MKIGSLVDSRLSRWFIASFVAINAFLLLWLLLKPGPHTVFVAVDNVAQTFGMLMGAVYCFAALGNRHRRVGTTPARRAHRWITILFGLGLLSGAIGQGIFTFYEQILHTYAPFPSWADAGYLGLYPFLFAGTLLLPAWASTVARFRILLDSLMIMAALFTFSWYFVLGPTFIEGDGTLFSKAVGVAYPVSDLIIAFSLLFFLPLVRERHLHNTVYLLIIALGIIIISDSINDYLLLHEAYETGGLLDWGWPLGYMLVGLSAVVLLHSETTGSLSKQPDATKTSLWRTLIPYALLPAVAALILYTLTSSGDNALKAGVYWGGAFLLAVILARQVFALKDITGTAQQIQQLNRDLQESRDQLHDAHEELQAAHEELLTHHEELRKAHARLESLATTDSLTQIANHRAMIDAIDTELARARRFTKTCSLLFLDIDHFKTLNDRHGHPAGDLVLQSFAQIVQPCLRSLDIFGRWGGEEFVVLLPETDVVGAEVIAEKVRSAAAAHLFPIDGGLHLTCSVGIATFPRDGADRNHLIAAADKAMYAAKHLGRNQVRVATDPAIAEASESQATITQQSAA
jgi:diguanylate cyclase (GGDEF)-like protein